MKTRAAIGATPSHFHRAYSTYSKLPLQISIYLPPPLFYGHDASTTRAEVPKTKMKLSIRSSAESRTRIATTTTASLTPQVVIFIAEQHSFGVLRQASSGAALSS
jgi:hypothetical protein